MLLKKTSTSLVSTILRVDSPVSNIIYVPHVRPPRLPWRKCRDIFVRQHMTRHKKKRPQCDPCLMYDYTLLTFFYFHFFNSGVRLSKKSFVGFHMARDFVARGRPPRGQTRLAPLAKRSTCSKSIVGLTFISVTLYGLALPHKIEKLFLHT